MARAGLRFMIFGLAAAGLLMGCVEGGGKASPGDGPGLSASPAKKKGGAQEVEAPEVFQTTDSALWDGRPSLGGIWVASTDVTNPERVLIFNPATGKSITGALFKRERDNPGPKLQLSSDAAEGLGILAGQPTEIRVTALRKVEEAAAPVADVAAEGAALAGAEGAAATDPAQKDAAKKDAGKKGSGEAAAIASAALAAVEADKPASGKPASDPAATPADPAAAGVAAVAADGAAAVVDGKPQRKTWKERRAEAKAAREAKKRAAAEAAAAASAAESGAAMAGGEVPAATAASGAVAAIESAPLDARSPESVAAKPETKSKRKTVGDAPAPVADAAAKADAANAAPAAAGGPVRPIQVASFSKEDNASRAAEALAKIGVTAKPQKSEKGGKAVWGVIVQGDDAMLKKIKDAGFADAYFLK